MLSFQRTFLLILLALFLPWLSVWIEFGFFTVEFWLNVALGFLTCGVGSVIHAIYIILAKRYDEAAYEGYTPVGDAEATYVVIVPEDTAPDTSSRTAAARGDCTSSLAGTGPVSEGNTASTSVAPPPYAEVDGKLASATIKPTNDESDAKKSRSASS